MTKLDVIRRRSFVDVAFGGDFSPPLDFFWRISFVNVVFFDHICIPLHTFTHVYTRIHMFTHVFTHVYTRTACFLDTRSFLRTFTHVYTCQPIHQNLPQIKIHTFTHVYTSRMSQAIGANISSRYPSKSQSLLGTGKRAGEDGQWSKQCLLVFCCEVTTPAAGAASHRRATSRRSRWFRSLALKCVGFNRIFPESCL